ncbi:MAG: helix-turn-helix domain-containing protein [Azospirillaceae bacterium]|nr:helix-turn-helix domain-containing protein [Azospirillaceae bacterium]
MTPFGQRMRDLREQHGLALKDMAAALHISSAYLSALEHGRKGTPSPMLVRQICGYFGIIWDEAEEMERLARMSDPRVVVDTSGLSPKATLAANRLAQRIGRMSDADLERLLEMIGTG